LEYLNDVVFNIYSSYDDYGYDDDDAHEIGFGSLLFMHLFFPLNQKDIDRLLSADDL